MKKRTLRVYSRHFSHDPLRKSVFVDALAMIRFGSTTKPLVNYQVEINSIQAVKNSASKLLMKQCFTKASVKTAEWFTFVPADKLNPILFDSEGGCCDESRFSIDQMKFPIIIKHHFGSRGTGNYKLNTKEELEQWMKGKDISNYIGESYKTFLREYRLHCTEEGCFYACRKLLKNDTPADKRYQRHSDNSIWCIESNTSFNRPVNWTAIEADCVKALKSLGGDIMAFDVKVQSVKDGEGRVRQNPEWIVIESCSAPSLLEVGISKYREILPKLVNIKLHGKEQR